MADFWDNATGILEVTLPVIFGAVISKYVVNSWQKQKEKFQLQKDKFDLRKSILADYESSYGYELIIYYVIINEIIKIYSKDFEIDKNNKKVINKIVFPTDVEKYPKILLSKIYGEYKKNEQDIEIKKFRCRSTIHICYNSKEILDTLTEMTKLSTFVYQLLMMIMNATVSKGFSDAFQSYTQTCKELDEKGGTLRKMLSNYELKSN